MFDRATAYDSGDVFLTCGVVEPTFETQLVFEAIPGFC